MKRPKRRPSDVDPVENYALLPGDVLDLITQAVDALDASVGTKHGMTALYWDIIGVLGQHAGRRER